MAAAAMMRPRGGLESRLRNGSDRFAELLGVVAAGPAAAAAAAKNRQLYEGMREYYAAQGLLEGVAERKADEQVCAGGFRPATYTTVGDLRGAGSELLGWLAEWGSEAAGAAAIYALAARMQDTWRRMSTDLVVVGCLGGNWRFMDPSMDAQRVAEVRFLGDGSAQFVAVLNVHPVFSYAKATYQIDNGHSDTFVYHAGHYTLEVTRDAVLVPGGPARRISRVPRPTRSSGPPIGGEFERVKAEVRARAPPDATPEELNMALFDECVELLGGTSAADRMVCMRGFRPTKYTTLADLQRPAAEFLASLSANSTPTTIIRALQKSELHIGPAEATSAQTLRIMPPSREPQLVSRRPIGGMTLELYVNPIGRIPAEIASGHFAVRIVFPRPAPPTGPTGPTGTLAQTRGAAAEMIAGVAFPGPPQWPTGTIVPEVDDEATHGEFRKYMRRVERAGRKLGETTEFGGPARAWTFANWYAFVRFREWLLTTNTATPGETADEMVCMYAVGSPPWVDESELLTEMDGALDALETSLVRLGGQLPESLATEFSNLPRLGFEWAMGALGDMDAPNMLAPPAITEGAVAVPRSVRKFAHAGIAYSLELVASRVECRFSRPIGEDIPVGVHQVTVWAGHYQLVINTRRAA
jgi:hypothetical protein